MTTIIRIDDTSDGKQTLKHLQIHDVNTHFYTTCEQEIPKIPQNSSQVWKPTIDPGPPELILIFLDAVETFWAHFGSNVIHYYNRYIGNFNKM